MGEVIPFLPRWARTICSVRGSGSFLRSHCDQCHREFREFPDELYAAYGDFNLLKHVAICRHPGCGGLLEYRAHHRSEKKWVRVTDLETIEKKLKERNDESC